MSDRPLVSVIMIFLDAERFIEEAIASVFAQTWPHWELLLVDDGSTDRSTAIAKKNAQRHPGRVRYLEHPGHVNRGMSASRNHGIAAARGDYIAFLDADDVYLPERLARHVALLEQQPEVDAAQGETLYWYSWQGPSTGAAPDCVGPVLPFEPGSVVAPPGLLLLLLDSDGSTAPGVCDLTVRYSLIDAIGGFEDSFRGLYEDQVFFAKVYLDARVGLVGECLARYRQHPESCTQMARRQGSSRPGRWDPARPPFLRWLEGYLGRRRVCDPRVLAAVTRHIWPLRHPRLARVMMLPTVLAEEAAAAGRTILRLVLPAPIYARLLHWRGEIKHRSWRAHIARVARRTSGDMVGD